MRVRLLISSLFIAWMVWLCIENRRKEMESAYYLGTSVQLSKHGALVICSGKADYIAVPHRPGAGEFVRRYVEAVCR